MVFLIFEANNMFLIKLFRISGIVMICFAVQIAAAHHRPKMRSNQPCLLEATVQRTLPGARGAEPVITQRILLVWESSEIPQTFFWRPDANTWMTCAATRVHGYKKLIKLPYNPEYQTEIFGLQDIHRGDTLELVPMHGRDMMPADAKSKPLSAVYFTVEKKKDWQTIPVKHFEKMPDIIMP